MDNELEVIRNEMDETRESLATKLEALENQVLGTVQTATETVSTAVGGAKEVVTSVTEGAKEVVEKVTETVSSVKESLDVTKYVEQYPWVSVGAAVAVGFAAGQLLGAGRSTSGNASEALPPASDGYYQPAAPASHHQHSGPALGGALEGIWHSLAPTVGGLAVGTLMSLVKDVVTSSLPPEWQGELNRVVDDITHQLGGKVMKDNPLHDLLAGLHARQGGPVNGPSAPRPPAGPGAGM